jgi:Outer membrane protein beta-barrel domain
MTDTARLIRVIVIVAVTSSALVPGAAAQTADSSWSAEASVGWDIGLSGDFLSAGIGTLQGVPTIITPQSFGRVYGNGVQWQFSAGYMVDEINEVRAQFSYQRVGSDVVTIGTAGASDLVATFDDYKSFNVEAGYRHYFARRRDRMRPYAGATLGVAIITEIDAVFAASAAGITRYATDFYDGTAALTLGVNGGTLYGLNERIDLNLQAGFRYNSGLSEIDALRETDLESINDKSARWTMPIMVGIRVNF